MNGCICFTWEFTVSFPIKHCHPKYIKGIVLISHNNALQKVVFCEITFAWYLRRIQITYTTTKLGEHCIHMHHHFNHLLLVPCFCLLMLFLVSCFWLGELVLYLGQLLPKDKGVVLQLRNPLGRYGWRWWSQGKLWSVCDTSSKWGDSKSHPTYTSKAL